jgi:hypothetical protein
MIKQDYPLLFYFFNAAFQVSDGSKPKDSDFDDITPRELKQAEAELRGISHVLDVSALGMLADSGYTMSGKTQGNDDQHVLLAYTLLERSAK